jgi:hypothetical protein
MLALLRGLEQAGAFAHVVGDLQGVERFVFEARQIALSAGAEQRDFAGAAVDADDEGVRAAPEAAERGFVGGVLAGAVGVTDDERPCRVRGRGGPAM